MSAAPMSKWDPVMLEVYLTDVEEPDLHDQLKLELRRSILSKDYLAVELQRRGRPAGTGR